MKKIMLVVPNLNNSGGTECAAISLANLLVPNYSVTLLSLTKKKGKTFYNIKQDVRIIYMDSPNNTNIAGKAAWFCYTTLNIRKIIKKYNINIIIGFTHNVNCLISLLKLNNIKTIGCEHIAYETIPKISKAIINSTYPKLNSLVVLSNQAHQNIKHLNKNVRIIPNSLSFETKKISSLDNNRILMVGRLSKEKGIERIIPLAKYLISKYPSWSIDIFGDGDLKIDIESLIKQNNLYNVRLNSPVQDIKSEYLKSSIFLSTSYTEALPMSFLEAMQCGVPVISYRHPGSDALITHNVNGTIVKSEIELIEQTASLIENMEIRKALGQNGRKFSSKFTTSKIKQQWLTLIESLDKN